MSPTIKTMGDIMDFAKASSLAAFVSHLGPAVLVTPKVEPSEQRSSWSYQTSGAADETTGNSPMATFRESAALPLRKAAGSAFANTLLVGRAASNDVCVSHDSVSKLHARIRVHRDGRLEVSDAGSRNGTSVNDREVEQGEAVELRHGDALRLGHRTFKVYMSSRLFESFSSAGF